ncbi:MAG TPA: ketoacyl-ACP synthase III [Caulobacteraceae bacterium]
MATGKITAIASQFPEGVLTSDALAELYPGWPAAKIIEKTGIRERRICATNETALDLGEKAALKLLAETGTGAGEIDFVVFCTQTPDHALPGNAALLHRRLGLRPDCGVLDTGLGCSGFVYGLAVVEGLIATAAADCVLLVTGDTYSKFIHPMDRSVRTLFGDAAAATLVRRFENGDRAIGPFVFGADGRGAENIIVPAGGARLPAPANDVDPEPDEFGNVRGPANLYMNGAEVMAFALKTVPEAAARLMAKSDRSIGDYDLVVLHQASALLLDKLQRKLGVGDNRFVRRMESCGNTVSSTIPLALEPYLQDAGSSPRRALLVGFGVGYAWAAAEVVI